MVTLLHRMETKSVTLRDLVSDLVNATIDLAPSIDVASDTCEAKDREDLGQAFANLENKVSKLQAKLEATATRTRKPKSKKA